MVNNAAIQLEQELAETTEEDLDRVLAENLKGPSSAASTPCA